MFLNLIYYIDISKPHTLIMLLNFIGPVWVERHQTGSLFRNKWPSITIKRHRDLHFVLYRTMVN